MTAGQDAGSGRTRPWAKRIDVPQQNLTRAIEHQRAGRLDEAASIYDALLATDPGQGDALHLLGLIARKRGDLDRSLELLVQARDALPDFDRAHYHLGLVLAERGEHAPALESQQRAAALAPGKADILSEIGRLLALAGRLDEAVAAYREATKSDPDFALAAENLGKLLSAT